MQKKYFFEVIFIFLQKKLIFARFFGTASVRSRSLDQPLVPGLFSMQPYFNPTRRFMGERKIGHPPQKNVQNLVLTQN